MNKQSVVRSFLIVMMPITFLCIGLKSFGQTPGTKKIVELRLNSYECGDFCHIELENIKSKAIYDFNNIDEKTKDLGILERIQKAYYDNQEVLPRNMVGNRYTAMLEYRKTDVIDYSIDGNSRINGRKVLRWMINDLRKSNTANTSGNGRLSFLDGDGKLNFQSDCYVIVEGAYSYVSDAQNHVLELRSNGKSNAGYLWIPDYPSLSGKPFYATFFGPYHDFNACKRALASMPRNQKFYYAKKVSMQAMNQKEIRF